MIVSELQLYNFRRFKAVGDEPGLSISFHSGLNALIGENDSGKSAVIDAIKLVLLTKSNEYLRVVEDDFNVEDGHSAKEFRIDLTLSDFSENEAKNFVEILEFKKAGVKPAYFVHLHYRAWREGNKILTELRAGEIGDGVVLDGKARELLKCVYLRPLRDAEREMSSGRNSRISQILFNHPVFKRRDDEEEHKLIEILRTANTDIENYFTEQGGTVILSAIRETLASFNEQDAPSDAKLETSAIQLKAILESLSLSAAEIHPGLGELNLLFIAAELLLLQHDDNGGLRLALIEELEAHLHPQAQLRLIQHLQKEYNESGVQIIISTHSPVLASKINLKNLILLKNGKGFDLAPEKTHLEKGDYLFLQRFLDSSKANLFFAKGVIMIEGDAENLLIPIIADIIGLPLEKYGVSVVNVGSTAFLRYSRIFTRADESTIDIPVAVVTDCDVKPRYVGDIFDEQKATAEEEVSKKENYYCIGTVKGFIAPSWTFEYCLARGCLRDEFHSAVCYGMKVKNSNKYALTNKKIEVADTEVAAQIKEWNTLSQAEYAYKIYAQMLNSDGKSGLKAIVAQCMASILRWKISEVPDGVTMEQMFDLDLYRLKVDETKKKEIKERIEEDRYLKYIVDAIRYATQQ